MSKFMDYMIIVGLLIAAATTAWSVLTIHHLNIG